MNFPLGLRSGTVASIYTEIMREERVISHGSSFLVTESVRQRCTALITARHNFTGLNHFTGQMLPPGAIPNRVRLWIPSRRELSWMPFELPLLGADGHTPIWLDAERYGSIVDVAGLDLTELRLNEKEYGFPFLGCNGAPRYSDSFSPGQPVHIVGFPLTNIGTYPAVWTTGFIASDPYFPVQLPDPIGEIPGFLVSCRTWSGQSGSPVVLPKFGFTIFNGQSWHSLPERSVVNGIGGMYMPHIYTGRLNPPTPRDEPSMVGSSDLGIVWNGDVAYTVLRQVMEKRNAYPTEDY
jgi:hypothetical protein